MSKSFCDQRFQSCRYNENLSNDSFPTGNDAQMSCGCLSNSSEKVCCNGHCECIPRIGELIINGGFENTPNPFEHWIINSGVDQIDPGMGDTSHQGINAARLGFIEPHGLIYQDISGICPGLIYELDFFMSTAKDLCNAAVSVRLEFLDKYKNPLGNPALDILIPQNSLYESYTAFINVTRCPAPHRAFFARVSFETNTGADADGYVRLDDVSMTISCNNPTGNCGDCCTIFNDPDRRTKFGILNEQGFCHCRDICVQEVRLICAKPIDFVIPIPAVGDGLRPGCRGERFPLNPDGGCNIIITCADETLGPNCDRVFVNVGIQIIINSVLGPLVIERSIPLECTEFFAFPDGGAGVSGNALKEALKIIDGSCIVAQLQCQILDSGNPRVRVFGNIVDKLWKHENLWVEAIRAYSGITVEQEFGEPHKIGECTPTPTSASV